MTSWRKMTWVLVIWCVAILAWAIAGGAHANHQSVQDCLSQGVLTAQQCQNGANVGTGIGVAVVLGIGFFGFVFLSLVWFMTRGPARGRVAACGVVSGGSPSRASACRPARHRSRR
jgi:uncharacterized membrane protein